MSTKGNFAKDFILLFLLAFTLTSLYPKARIISNSSVSGWSIHWQTMWQATVGIFTDWPLLMIINILVIVFAMYLIWRDRRASGNTDNVNSTLREIKKMLEDMRDEQNRH